MIFRRSKPTSLVEGCWQPHELRPERQGAFINWKIGGVDTPRSSLDWVPCSDGEEIPNCKMRGRGGRGKDRRVARASWSETGPRGTALRLPGAHLSAI